MKTLSNTTPTLGLGPLRWRTPSVAMLLLLVALSATLDAATHALYDLRLGTARAVYHALQLALSLLVGLGLAAGVVGLIRDSPRLVFVAYITALFNFIAMLTLVAISLVSLRKSVETKVKEHWVTSGFYVCKLLLQLIAVWIYRKAYRHLLAGAEGLHDADRVGPRTARVPGL